MGAGDRHALALPARQLAEQRVWRAQVEIDVGYR
jgi:hypothetical protein